MKGGRIAGTYVNDAIAAVENDYGKGKTLLVGTYPGAGYFLHHSEGTRDFFKNLLEWGGVDQNVTSSDPEVKARLHDGPGGRYLWVINPTRTSRMVTIGLPESNKEINECIDLWSEKPVAIEGNQIRVRIDERDASVIHLISD